MAEQATWILEDFEARLDQWIELDDPGDDVRLLVTARLLSRLEGPYAGVRREPDFDNLWFGPVPGSLQQGRVVGGRVVVCSYWISETQRRVRCNSIASLNLPI